jgi:hypothetical protein
LGVGPTKLKKQQSAGLSYDEMARRLEEASEEGQDPHSTVEPVMRTFCYDAVVLTPEFGSEM